MVSMGSMAREACRASIRALVPRTRPVFYRLSDACACAACRYVIEDDQVLFSTQAGLHASEIRDYVVQQPECVAVEWNQKRKPGPAETPEWTAKNEVKKAEKEKAKKEKEAAEAAVKKAEERTEKKKKKAKKAAKAKAEL